MLIQKHNYISTLPDFLAYLVTAMVLVAVFLAVYTAVTPHREFRLVREGNTAAATSLAGALIGFILPLASAIAHSQSLIDAAVWGLIALVVQIVVFLGCQLSTPTLVKDIEQGRMAPAIFLASFALGAGMVNAVCMTY
ncbi:MAG: DUF350 domain-containing protein [Alphaproteobacteria bacterium]|nr:DUF350 domain-containing protein [Alphaproteobacteria bacterium]